MSYDRQDQVRFEKAMDTVLRFLALRNYRAKAKAIDGGDAQRLESAVKSCCCWQQLMLLDLMARGLDPEEHDIGALRAFLNGMHFDEAPLQSIVERAKGATDAELRPSTLKQLARDLHAIEEMVISF